MKPIKLLLISLLFASTIAAQDTSRYTNHLSLTTFILSDTLSISSPINDSVYICESSTSFAFHTNNLCIGLMECTHKVIKVSYSEARNQSRRRCNYCKIKEGW